MFVSNQSFNSVLCSFCDKPLSSGVAVILGGCCVEHVYLNAKL